MSWFFTNFFAVFLLPPLNLLLLMLAGLLLWHKRPVLARTLITTSFVLFWLLSTPYVAEALLHVLEAPAHPVDTQKNPADAIVVLGGGTYFNAPEYAGDTVSHASLERVRYAAWLYRYTNKPLLMTGGTPLGNRSAEAQLMQSLMEKEFNIEVKWVEAQSNNTFENAHYSYQILQATGIKRIYLVTHAWHMPRAMRIFQAAGFEVTPAPTAFTTRHHDDLLAFLPNAHALKDSQIFLHEMIGMLWYRLKS